jgi:nucleotide-binding universal stress UspA family protein
MPPLACANADNVDTLAVAGSPVEDLLVVGNVGLNTVSGRLLGSVPQKIARHDGVDVLIAHTS